MWRKEFVNGDQREIVNLGSVSLGSNQGVDPFDGWSQNHLLWQKLIDGSEIRVILESRVAKLERENKNLKKEVERLHAVNEENARIKEEIGRLTVDIGDFSRLVDDERDYLRGQNAEFAGELQCLRKSRKILSDEVRQLKLEKRDLQEKHECLVREDTRLKKSEIKLKEEKNRLLARIEELDTEIERLLVDNQVLQAQNLEVEKYAAVDALTGLFNRNFFESRVPDIFEREIRQKNSCGIVFIDLDEFKPFNDTLGHKVGDDLLRKVAAVFKRELRSSDLSMRIGGDEFLLFLFDVQNRIDMERKAEKIHHEIGLISMLSNEKVRLFAAASVGTYFFSKESDTTLKDAIDAADEAMYKAKSEGGNRVAHCREKE